VSTPTKILLVEDNVLDAELLERELRRGGIDFVLKRVDDREGFLAALEDGPDLVLSDFELPQFDGLAALELLKERSPDVPFVLVSGTIGEEIAVAAMRQGASDYLLKDRLSRLPTAVRSALEQAHLRREKRELEERLLRADRLESLGRLAGGVAHDLNNILAPILIAQGLLRQSESNPEAIELLDTIEANAQRGAKVLRQLLTFGRGTSGDRVPVLLSSVVDEMRAIMRETFPKNIEVSTEIASNAEVVADPTQLHQVLMNLCVNARDAMPDGGKLELTVRVVDLDAKAALKHPGAKPGSYAVLEVRDTGVGIPPEHLSRIFEPFFTTKRLDQGTGLGLSSVLGIVKGHGGFVDVNSSPRRGSRFSVYLPSQSAPRPVVSDTRKPDRARGTGQLVLLVDDEPSVLRVFRAGLASSGYQALSASDGAAALRLFEERGSEIALIVTDLAMPNLDGLGMVRALRELGADVACVVMAGAVTSEQASALRSLGVRHFLQKPFPIETLLDAIERALAPDPEAEN
jgi:two-component system cell cycle sensor histidine kinase/response regulator CckA